MKEKLDRQHRAASNAVGRITAALLSFVVVLGLLSLSQGLTPATRWVLSGFVGISVLMIGPKILAWFVALWP